MFCPDNCPHLVPKEYQQLRSKEFHKCRKYDRQVKHYQYHPRLVRLAECDIMEDNNE